MITIPVAKYKSKWANDGRLVLKPQSTGVSNSHWVEYNWGGPARPISRWFYCRGGRLFPAIANRITLVSTVMANCLDGEFRCLFQLTNVALGLSKRITHTLRWFDGPLQRLPRLETHQDRRSQGQSSQVLIRFAGWSWVVAELEIQTA
jgi:hypothetical protein